MIVKLLTEHHLEFLSLKGGCRGLSESTLVKCQLVGNLMPRLICHLYMPLASPNKPLRKNGNFESLQMLNFIARL